MSYMTMSRLGIYIDRYCDRCGEPITNPDAPMYFELQSKTGHLVAVQELCRECAAELADWLGGLELPPASEISEDIWD